MQGRDVRGNSNTEITLVENERKRIGGESGFLKTGKWKKKGLSGKRGQPGERKALTRAVN